MTPEQEDALVEQSLRESMAQSEASVRFSLGDAIRLAIRAAYAQGVAQERERCAAICESVNNYDNPMTANDCAAAIRRG